jgi:hypothetical protein
MERCINVEELTTYLTVRWQRQAAMIWLGLAIVQRPVPLLLENISSLSNVLRMLA